MRKKKRSSRSIARSIHTIKVRHITSNTGHVAVTTRAEVDDWVVSMLAPLAYLDGGPVPLTPGWRVRVFPYQGSSRGRRLTGSAFYTVENDPPPGGESLHYAICTACWHPESSKEAWQLARTAGAAHGWSCLLPVEAPDTPWLVVTLTLDIFFNPHPVSMLADFERCMFWALMEADLARA